MQPLPQNIVSITAIHLWLPELLRNRVHNLEVALLDSSGNRHALAETHDDLKLGSGWVRFLLDSAVQDDARNCTLTLRNDSPSKLVVGMGTSVHDRHEVLAEHIARITPPLDMAGFTQEWRAACEISGNSPAASAGHRRITCR